MCGGPKPTLEEYEKVVAYKTKATEAIKKVLEREFLLKEITKDMQVLLRTANRLMREAFEYSWASSIGMKDFFLSRVEITWDSKKRKDFLEFSREKADFKKDQISGIKEVIEQMDGFVTGYHVDDRHKMRNAVYACMHAVGNLSEWIQAVREKEVE